MVSLLAAVVLFMLSVGSVRGLRPLPRRHDGLRPHRRATSSPARPSSCSRAVRPARRAATAFGLGRRVESDAMTSSRRRPSRSADLDAAVTRRLPPGQRRRRPLGFVLGQTAIDFSVAGESGFGISVVADRHQPDLARPPAASTSASTSRAASSWDVPASSLTVDEARPVLTDNGHRGRGRRRSSSALEQRRHHQGPGRRPAPGRAADDPATRSPRRPASIPTRSASHRSARRGASEITRRRSRALVVFLVAGRHVSSRCASSGGWRSPRSSRWSTT